MFGNKDWQRGNFTQMGNGGVMLREVILKKIRLTQAYMKNLLFVSLSVLLLLGTACKKTEGPTGEIPDLKVSLTLSQNGTTLDQIAFEGDGQMVPANSAAGGSYNDLANLFAVNFNGGLGTIGPNFGYSGDTGGVKTGSYGIGSSVLNIANFTSSTGGAYSAIDGSFKIEQVQEYLQLANIEEFFIDGSVDFTMVNLADSSEVITLSGTFSGVNIKSN
jgi:hypothetical protein